MRTRTRAVWVGVLCAAAQVAQAAGSSAPDALRALEPWATQDLSYLACPLKSGQDGTHRPDFVCEGAGALSLSPDAHGATFAQTWVLDVAGAVPLPGSRSLWPVSVAADGLPVPVVGEDTPLVWLEAGHHRLTGRWDWETPPDRIPAPPSSPWRVTAQGSSSWRVDASGWSRTAADAPLEGKPVPAESLQITVQRLLEDGAPPRLTTRLHLAVAGAPRRMNVGPVLPAGFSWSGVEGDVGTHWETDGTLTLSLESGTHDLTVYAHGNDLLKEALRPEAAQGWPDTEVWAYHSDESWRATRAEGGSGIDPFRADTPVDWRRWPTFVLGKGQGLRIKELPARVPDAGHLTVDRTAWLSFDGTTWSFRDAISGTLHRDWRLDVAPPLRLTHATGAAGSPLLITRLSSDSADGVEWRASQVGLLASLTTPRAPSLPVSGWRAGVDGVHWNVHLPYGYVALAAWGAERQAGTWWASWSIWDAFLAALIVVLAFRAWKSYGLVAALAYVLLTHAEPMAPFMGLFVELVLVALWSRAPEGGLRRFAFALAVVGAVMVGCQAVPFAASNLRIALHPQLQGRELGPADGINALYQGLMPNEAAMSRRRAQVYAGPTVPGASDGAFDQASNGYVSSPEEVSSPHPVAAPPEVPLAPLSAPSVSASAGVPLLSSSHEPPSLPPAPQALPPDRVAQVGVGDPSWSGVMPVSLSWTRPVAPTEEVRLWLLPPSAVRPLRALLALLTLAGLWALVRRLLPEAPQARAPRPLLPGVAPLLLLGGLMLPGLPRAAELPDPG